MYMAASAPLAGHLLPCPDTDFSPRFPDSDLSNVFLRSGLERLGAVIIITGDMTHDNITASTVSTSATCLSSHEAVVIMELPEKDSITYSMMNNSYRPRLFVNNIGTGTSLEF